MASGPIIAWQIEGGKLKVVTGFLFLGSKIAMEGGCSHEITRQLLPGRKAMTNPGRFEKQFAFHSVLKSRDITLPTKV